MSDFDERLAQAMRKAAAPSPPHIDELVSGGIARGVRMRRRHRWRMAGGVAALGAATGGAALIAPPLLGGGDDDTTRSPGVMSAPPGALLTEDSVVATVRELLPEGEVVDVRSGTESGPGVEAGTVIWFEFTFDDGAGAGFLQGSVAHRDDAQLECPPTNAGGSDIDASGDVDESEVTDDPDVTDTPAAGEEAGGDEGGADTASCEKDVLDDGTELLVTAGEYYPKPEIEPDRLLWNATASLPNGLVVVLGQVNAPTEKDSEVSRPEPPLSADEMAAVVTSDRWVEFDVEIPEG
ncbi:hypothetical protein [Phytoactinopolyspora limicola]|uniref:hypothetical protein n=1 Tax=Phytoactinopolyspora limicola TaxID=2715536 RepID=UPI00140A1A97|nr:hypothetical protein [Phytoactinopolyspora limicola]